MDDITDADYIYTKRVFKDYEIKALVEYHDFNVQSYILFLADVFDNSQNMYFEIYELDPAHFLSAPGLV